MEVLQEASISEVVKARKILLLAEVQNELRDQGEWQLRLSLISDQNKYGEDWYVIARNDDDEIIKGAGNGNVSGIPGHLYQMRSDTPKSIAAGLVRDRKWFDAKKAEAGA